MSDSDRHERHKRKRRYYSLLRAVEYNEAPKPGMKSHSLIQNRKQAGYDLETTRKTVSAAIENGDLAKITDRDGTTRYVRTKDHEVVKAAIEWLLDADDVDRESIGNLNTALSK